MPVIIETIVTTTSAKGVPHIAPLGLIKDGEGWILAPFHPSTTLQNLRDTGVAVANYTDDVRIFAGCLTGRRDWPLVATGIAAPRLAAALSHAELAVVGVDEHPERPRFHCKVVAHYTHAPFAGLNRAKNAVLELAILASRLHMLPREKVEREVEYLRIAIGKTAGAAELEAWGWLMERVERFYAGHSDAPKT